MSLVEHYFKVSSLYLAPGIRIQIRIKVRGRIRIQILIKVKGRIRIRIQGTSRIRIRIKVMAIHNTAWGFVHIAHLSQGVASGSFYSSFTYPW